MSGGGGAPQMMFLPSQQTTTNQIPQWVQDAGKANYDAAANIDPAAFAAYTGPRVADMNPYQTSAINSLFNNIGATNGGYQNAMNAGNTAIGQAGANYGNAGNSAAGVSNSINGLQGQVGQVYKDINLGPNPAQNAMNWLMQATGYKPDQVAAQTVPQGDLNAYMNPYTQNVIDASLSDLGRQKENALNSNADKAASMKAFGNSRYAIQNAVTDAEYGRNAGSLSANLRNQNYNQALAALQQDQAKNLQAQLANQSAGLQNLGLGINAASNAGQMGLTNQGQNLQAQQYNNSNALANQQNNISALQSAGSLGINQGNLYNSIANSQGNLGLQNAQLQGQLTGQQQSDYLNSLNAALQGGGMLQQQQQNQINAAMQQYADQQNALLGPLNLRMQALGMTPYNTSSSTSGFSSQMYQPTSSNPFMGALGGGLAGIKFGPWGAAIGGGLGLLGSLRR